MRKGRHTERRGDLAPITQQVNYRAALNPKWMLLTTNLADRSYGSQLLIVGSKWQSQDSSLGPRL